MIDLISDGDYGALRDLALDVGEKILWAAVVIIVGFWLGRLARVRVQNMLSRREMGWNGTVLLSRLTSIAIQAASILIALSILGVSGTGLLALASAFTVAIGLSLQDVLKNFFAGIYLLLERPFRAGDRIMVEDVVGEVQGIDVRTTLVKSLDNELVLIPNATIFTDILRNDTHYGIRRLEFTITSATRSIREIEQQIQQGLASVDGVKRPIPAARIVASEPSKLQVTSSLVIDNRDEVQTAATEAMIHALEGDTIEVVSK